MFENKLQGQRNFTMKRKKKNQRCSVFITLCLRTLCITILILKIDINNTY